VFKGQDLDWSFDLIKDPSVFQMRDLILEEIAYQNPEFQIDLFRNKQPICVRRTLSFETSSNKKQKTVSFVDNATDIIKNQNIPFDAASFVA